MSKKKIIIIVSIILLLLVGVFCIYWFLLREKSSGSSEVVVDSNIAKESIIPEYKSADLSEISALVLEEMRGWSSDFRILSITATTQSIVDGDMQVYFGNEGGKFSSWIFNIYSPSKNSETVYMWSSGNTSFSEDMVIEEKFLIDAKKSEAYFNNLNDLRPTEDIVNTAIENGLDLSDSYIYLYMGSVNTMDYGNRYVWKVTQRSKVEKDEYGTGKHIMSYIIDGETLELVNVTESEY
jgi:hypothetical protein